MQRNRVKYYVYRNCALVPTGAFLKLKDTKIERCRTLCRYRKCMYIKGKINQSITGNNSSLLIPGIGTYRYLLSILTFLLRRQYKRRYASSGSSTPPSPSPPTTPLPPSAGPSSPHPRGPRRRGGLPPSPLATPPSTLPRIASQPAGASRPPVNPRGMPGKVRKKTLCRLCFCSFWLTTA